MISIANQKRLPPSPIIFGEVLFDHFPDGAMVLGGAAFNVAWHLKGFGLEPLLISSVGHDTLGAQLLASMADWGMDCSGIQRTGAAPTGIVKVTIINDEPHFDIMPDQAYDLIDSEQALQAIRQCSPTLLYHGTLGIRHQTSFSALNLLRKKLPLPIYLDINLRPPWYSAALLEHAMRHATWAKFNAAEWREVLPLLSHATVEGEQAQARNIVQRYALESLLLTRGEAGAWCVRADEWCQGAPTEVPRLIDTVGAGDAFSAVVIYGISQGWQWPVLLPRAIEFATAICGERGAVCESHTRYRSFLKQWNG